MRLEYFEMIDAIDAIDVEAGTVTAISRLPEKSPIFEGHFPGYPTLPGVMMLELINHAAGYVIFRRYDKAKFVFLGAVKRAKFRQFIGPGAVVQINAQITHDGSGFAIAEGTVVVDGKVAADAETVMIVADFPSPELKAAFRRHFELIAVAAASA